MTRAVLVSALFLLLLSGHTSHADAEKSVTVLIAYYSRTGNTRAMAEAVERGVRSIAGAEAKLRRVGKATTDDVLAADAIILGSPVYNANVAPPVQEFINGWPFRGAPLEDKLGAAFVSAGGLSAGEEATQLSLLRSMLIFGMVVVGGADWRAPFGASAVVNEGPFHVGDDSPVDELFTRKAEALGKRVAELAARLKEGG